MPLKDYKTEGYILVGCFAAWKLWPVISPILSLGSTVTETAAAAAAGATANIQVTSQLAIDKAKLRTIWPNATEANIAKLRSDARALASWLGTRKGEWSSTVLFPSMSDAFHLLKTEYSRLLLYNNKPYDAQTKKTTSAETKTSAKRSVYWTALQPFYDEYTGGNSLSADMTRMVFSKTEYKPYQSWVL